MVLVSVLKRKDAASVAVAVVLGFIVYALLSVVAEPLASSLSGRNPKVVGDWQTQYLYPLVLAALEIIFLEILAWLYIWTSMAARKK